MEIRKAIEFLKKKVKEIPALKELSYNNQGVIKWRNSIEDVLEETFRRNSTEFKRFFGTRKKTTKTHESRADKQKRYVRQLTRRKTAIESIINKWKIIGLKDKPDEKEPPTTLESPIQLFDSIHFHERVIKASRSLFENKHYAQAIFEAFKAIELFVKDKANSKAFGTNLMETVFNEENPVIKVPEGGHYYKEIQRGFKHLFIGATQALRNPKAHKDIVQKDPYITLEYLGFASFLLKRIDYWNSGIS